jgi:ADP-ribosylglycohydrolase
MIGAIIGDIVGSRFEFNNTDKKDFKLFTKDCDFTDDTICTVAVADAILRNVSFKDSLLHWCAKYPNPMGAYGGSFSAWLRSPIHEPYNSFGNGSAMRVSPCALAARSDYEAIRLAYDSAACTHNHAEGVIGAVATALVIRAFQASAGRELTARIDAESIISTYYGEDWNNRLPVLGYFDVTCQGCVPLAYYIIDNSHSFEDAIRNAVSYGGDSDTLAAIVGSMAEALWGVPEELKEQAFTYLPEEMKQVINQFYATVI